MGPFFRISAFILNLRSGDYAPHLKSIHNHSEKHTKKAPAMSLKRVAQVVAFALILAVVHTVYKDLKSGANQEPLLIRSNPTDGIRIQYHSPWKTSGWMELDERTTLDGLGVWRIPDNGRPLIAGVVVVAAGDQAITNYRFEYSFSESYVRDWHPVAARPTAHGIELSFPTSSSMLFPKYGSVINWKGDAFLIAWAALRIGYPFTLIVVVTSAVWSNRRAVQLGFRSVCRELKPDRLEAIAGALGVGLFFVLNSRNSSLPAVMVRHFDELTILRPIEALRPMDMIYGMIYNIACLPFVGPGVLCKSISWAIVGGRMLSAVSMLSCWLVFRRIVAIYLSGLPLHLLSLFPLTVPFFWVAGTLFRPDALMAAVLLCSWLFFLKDHGRLGFSSRIAITLYAAAVAVKSHALMFYPVVPAYVLFASRREGIGGLIRNVICFTAVVGVTFLSLEPRAFSLECAVASVDGFMFQMWTNRTGFDLHYTGESVALAAKLATVFRLYSPLALLASVAICSFVVSLRQCRSRNFRLVPFHITNLIVLVYYGCFLNKDWAYYYVSPFFIFITVCVFQVICLRLVHRVQIAFVLAVLLIQLLIPGASWRSVIGDAYMPTMSAREKSRVVDQELEKLLIRKGEEGRYLISYGVPFDYLSFGLTHSQVSYVSGDVLRCVAESDYSFLEEFGVDFIVLNRSQTMRNAQIAERFRLVLPQLGFLKVFEDEYVSAFRRK